MLRHSKTIYSINFAFCLVLSLNEKNSPRCARCNLRLLKIMKKYAIPKRSAAESEHTIIGLLIATPQRYNISRFGKEAN
jgi:hypothetical protein